MQPMRLANAARRMKLGLPTFLSFNVTNRCTQRCPMCSVWREPSEELSLNEIERILGEFREAGLAVVEVSGGEPFLRDDLFDILSVLDRLGFIYTVNTNGTLLTPEAVEDLSRRKGLLQLAVSLDSLDSERYATLCGTDSLPRVLESVRMLTDAKRRPASKLNVAMSRVNCDEVLDLLRFARERKLGMSVFPVIQGEGFAHRSADPLFEASDAERARMAELFRQLARLRRAGEPLWEYSGYYDAAADYIAGTRKAGCDAGRVFFDLRANGDLAACVDLPPFADMRSEHVKPAIAVVERERSRIRACSQATPCCYTCTANVTETARHPVRFIAETARVRVRSALRRKAG